MSKEGKGIYEWAIKKEVGFGEDTANALKALFDYASSKKIDKDVERRWIKLGRIKRGKVHLDNDETNGDGTAWILMGLEYEGKVERKIAES